jgi:hypothetical protein
VGAKPLEEVELEARPCQHHSKGARLCVCVRMHGYVGEGGHTALGGKRAYDQGP